jgi:hypothetical protein
LRPAARLRGTAAAAAIAERARPAVCGAFLSGGEGALLGLSIAAGRSAGDDLLPLPQTAEQSTARPGEPTREQGYAFLALFERVLERFRPEVLLTYGGHWLAEEMMVCAKRHGVRVVFAIHNFAYRWSNLFRLVDAVLVPSRCAEDHYRRTLGLECTPTRRWLAVTP